MEAFRKGDRHLARYRERVQSITSIPIQKLIHVTHFEAAQAIKNDGVTYKFQPQVKYGKCYDPGSCLPTQGNRFDKISDSICVFCGNKDCNHKFSWWGIDISEWYKEGRGVQFSMAVDVLNKKPHYAYVPDFLKNPPESTYGTQGFSMELSTLIRRYRKSRDDSNDKVCFRIGGTLEYTQEVAYVIIVCMGNELNDAAYPRMDRNVSAIFENNGLLNDLGEVKDCTEIPEFKLAHLIIKKYEPPTAGKRTKREWKFNWQNLVFAFYLPNGDLKCKEKDFIGDVCSIPHYHPNCHSRLGHGKVCPDYDNQKNGSCFQELQLCREHNKFSCPKCKDEMRKLIIKFEDASLK